MDLTIIHFITPLGRTDKNFVSFDTYNPTHVKDGSHWLSQS